MRRLAHILLNAATVASPLMWLIVMAGHPIPASACSGPGAHRAIAESIAYAHWSALGVGLGLLPIAYRYVRAGHFGAAKAHVLLLALHPAWWLSARSGDCGQALSTMSTLWLAATAVAWAVSPLVVHWLGGVRHDPRDSGTPAVKLCPA